jgi:hypothetical protein
MIYPNPGASIIKWQEFRLTLRLVEDEPNLRIFVQSPVGDTNAEGVASHLSTTLFDESIAFRLDYRSTADAAVMGFKLGQVLFPEHVYSLLLSSMEYLKPEAGLRVRLVIDHTAAKLQPVPWELVTYQSKDAVPKHLLLDRRVSFLRHESLRQVSIVSTHSRSTHVRVVSVLASPSSDALPPLPFGNIEKELLRLEVDPNITLVPVGRPTLTNLGLTAPPANVFHFAGHGQFERQAGSIGAGLSFETDQGAEHFVTAENVAKEVRRLGVGVAILTACYGASRSATSPAAGISAALTRAGVTTVIAFASPIDDLVACDALHELVDTILERGALDAAITDARATLHEKFHAQCRWASLVVATRCEGPIAMIETMDDCDLDHLSGVVIDDRHWRRNFRRYQVPGLAALVIALVAYSHYLLAEDPLLRSWLPVFAVLGAAIVLYVWVVAEGFVASRIGGLDFFIEKAREFDLKVRTIDGHARALAGHRQGAIRLAMNAVQVDFVSALVIRKLREEVKLLLRKASDLLGIAAGFIGRA